MSGFVAWLSATMEERGWSNSELARRAGVVPSTVSMVISGTTRPGLDLCLGVARAFGIPPEDVLRRAGLLPALPEPVAEERELVTILREQSPATRRVIVSMLRGLVRRQSPGDAMLAEIIATYERVSPEWRGVMLETARRMEQNERGPVPVIIGGDDESAD